MIRRTSLSGLRLVPRHKPVFGCHCWLVQQCFGLVVWLPVLLLTSAGCLDRGPEKIRPVAVDPASAAASAMEKYDANHDGSLDKSELAASPALAAWFSVSDDNKMTEDAIATRLAGMFTGTSLLGVDCQVLLDGRPLSQATVRLVPEDIFGDALQPAEGITDESGAARPTIAAEDLPQNLQGTPLMAPGLYRVEITHSQVSLPSRYNAATELGMAIDPSQRNATGATFRLKSK
jgi:hypothetical protein